MLTLESLNPDKKLSVFLTIKFAEKSLHIYEAQYPADIRPRAAIEAAKEWLRNPSDTTAAYYGAADAARAARDWAGAVGAADAAAWAADAAGNAASNSADAAAWAASYAAGNAAFALRKDKASFVHSVLMENADVILEHMVKEEVVSPY